MVTHDDEFTTKTKFKLRIKLNHNSNTEMINKATTYKNSMKLTVYSSFLWA